VDAADVLVLHESSLPSGAVIGTSSIRRRAQLLRAFPGVTVDDLRGNVDTRLRKVADGTVDAVVWPWPDSSGSASRHPTRPRWART
jgi:hydroxymethylbilane synthase